jgi:hypothetical protein
VSPANQGGLCSGEQGVRDYLPNQLVPVDSHRREYDELTDPGIQLGGDLVLNAGEQNYFLEFPAAGDAVGI